MRRAALVPTAGWSGSMPEATTYDSDPQSRRGTSSGISNLFRSIAMAPLTRQRQPTRGEGRMLTWPTEVLSGDQLKPRHCTVAMPATHFGSQQRAIGTTPTWNAGRAPQNTLLMNGVPTDPDAGPGTSHSL